MLIQSNKQRKALEKERKTWGKKSVVNCTIGRAELESISMKRTLNTSEMVQRARSLGTANQLSNPKMASWENFTAGLPVNKI